MFHTDICSLYNAHYVPNVKWRSDAIRNIPKSYTNLGDNSLTDENGEHDFVFWSSKKSRIILCSVSFKLVNELYDMYKYTEVMNDIVK